MWRYSAFNKIPKKKKRKYCSSPVSDYKGTFLCGNHIAAWKIVLFVNHFLSHLRDHKTIFQYLGFFTNSSIDWRSFCSEVCLAWFKNQKPIRGEEIGVEIDDTLKKRRIYERGSLKPNVALLQDRASQQAPLCCCPDRRHS